MRPFTEDDRKFYENALTSNPTNNRCHSSGRKSRLHYHAVWDNFSVKTREGQKRRPDVCSILNGPHEGPVMLREYLSTLGEKLTQVLCDSHAGSKWVPLGTLADRDEKSDRNARKGRSRKNRGHSSK